MVMASGAVVVYMLFYSLSLRDRCLRHDFTGQVLFALLPQICAETSKMGIRRIVEEEV